MNKKINFIKNEKLTGDAVIYRGYAIYDEWLKNKLSSRKIVESVENAVYAIAKKKTKSASAEALSYLFALDMRIRERYKSILHCIFRYFSWRRETGALKRLKDIFNIPEEGDIRDAIEIALKAIRESIDAEDIEDSDDEIHGGKKNGKEAEEDSLSEEKEQEATAEENPEIEELEDSEEKNEETPEETAEENLEETAEEKVEEIDPNAVEEQALEAQEEQLAAESQMQSEELVTASENQIEQSEIPINLEINSSVELNSTPLANTNINNGGNYINSFDALFFDSDGPSEKSEEISRGGSDLAESKGDDGDYAAEDSVDESTRSKDEDSAKQNDASKEDADEIDSEDPLQNEEANKDGKKTEEQETPQETKQEGENLNVTPKVDNKNDMRVPIQVDITNDEENEYRKEMHSCLTDEMLYAMANRQAEAAREQISVAMAEFGSDQPFEMIGFDNLDEVKETTNVIDKK